ncbi:hypothetical protein AeRB84_021580 [Aphanomyces euteiches]|nr:hypothetical protein AeRB84_021580 [Aphanomyces euteiches]
MIERIVRHVMSKGPPSEAPDLVPTLKDIETYWETTLMSMQTWKIQLNDPYCLAKIQIIGDEIFRLQDRLLQVTENLHVHLKIQVVGTIDDLRYDVGNLMNKMATIAKCLESIAGIADLQQQQDSLLKLAIQFQRSPEREVALGNIPRINDFQELVEFCKDQIGVTAQVLSETREMPKSFSLEVIQTWMLSSDDVSFEPENERSILGQGGFGSVNVTDSADLEKLIAREVKAWKDISNERYMLTLIGVCTKIPKPIVVCELCQKNIRRYVRDWPETLIPLVYQFARGLLTLHNANIIHRDLKGDNVLITFQNTVAIADFGLSRTATSFENTMTDPKVAGTLNWMSPEQYFTPRSVTTKSDVWSFGMTLWEVVCCDTPYKGCSIYEFEEIFQTDDDRPEKPEEFDPILEPMWTLITMCWEREPSARSSASDIVNYLKEHYSSELPEF